MRSSFYICSVSASLHTLWGLDSIGSSSDGNIPRRHLFRSRVSNSKPAGGSVRKYLVRVLSPAGA